MVKAHLFRRGQRGGGAGSVQGRPQQSLTSGIFRPLEQTLLHLPRVGEANLRAWSQVWKAVVLPAPHFTQLSGIITPTCEA